MNASDSRGVSAMTMALRHLIRIHGDDSREAAAQALGSIGASAEVG